MELSEEDVREFLRIVRDDLVFLKSLNYRTPSRTDVRVASSILRRLLYEGMFPQAWKFAGLDGMPHVTATDLDAMVSNVPGRYIHYAYAGGAKTEGARHDGYMLLVVPKSEAQAEGYDAAMQRISKLFRPGLKRTFGLAEFCLSPAVVSGEAAVSRMDVIRYVANKLGGVHWDNRREAWSHPVGSRHRLLDEDHIMVGRLSAPFYEILSIAEAVADSDDTDRLIKRIDEIAPEDERAANVLSFREGRIGKYADMTFGPGKAE